MKPWAAWIGLLALAGLAGAQSLGDAARKERERRDKVRETQPSARTLTDDDLASTKGALANDPEAAPPQTTEAEEGGESSASGGPPTSRGLRQAVPDAVPPAGGEEHWRARAAQARGRIAEAQRRNEAFQRMIRFGQPARYDETGRRVIFSVERMKEKADAAEAELRAAEKALEDLLEEGRKAGALPGWLR